MSRNMASRKSSSKPPSRCSSISSLRSEGSESWGYVGKESWQPDRIPESDATFLNHKKQERAKDPRQALQEQLEFQQKLKESIQQLIKKPFMVKKSGGVGVDQSSATWVTEKVAAKKKFVVAHFSHCYKVKNFHLPSEFAFVEFSVFNGLGKGIQGFVDTGEVLKGFAYEARDQCKYLCNPLPPFDPDFNAERDALRLIRDFLAVHFEENEQVIIFALKEYIPVVKDGLHWLIDAAGLDHDDNGSDGTAASRLNRFNFEVLPFANLIVELMNESQTPEYRANISDTEKYHVDHECLIENDLRYSKFSYYSDLACEYHMKPENLEGVPRCCETLVKSYVFNAFSLVKPFFNIQERANAHFPDLKLIARKTQNKRFSESAITAGPDVAGRITRFTSSERMSDFITNFSGSDISGSGSFRSVEQMSSSGSSTVSGGSKLNSAIAPALPADTRRKRGVLPPRQLTMPINKPTKMNKFKVDPEVRYAYNLEDYQNQTAKSGKVDQRPSYEEALINKSMESTSCSSETSISDYHRQPDQRRTNTAITARGNRTLRSKGRGRGRNPRLNPFSEECLSECQDDINEPGYAFEDLPPAVPEEEEDIHGSSDLSQDGALADGRSHASLSTNSTLTSSEGTSGFYKSYSVGDDADSDDDYPDSASVVNGRLRNLKI